MLIGDWRSRSLDDLLTEHDLAGLPEHEFPTDGWSGSRFTTIERGNERFVLKRTSPRVDWIVRATRDDRLREAWMAACSAGPGSWIQLGGSLRLPSLGAAADPADPDGAVILMPDLSVELIAWERPGHEPAIDLDTLDRVVDAVALLHALPWSHSLTGQAELTGEAPPPWCPLPERLTLLTPRSAAAYDATGEPVGRIFLDGWAAFDRHASAAARDLIRELSADVTPLVLALQRLPAVGLHGDLKLANVALPEDGSVAFIDWQMTLQAPVAVELGWFLVTNHGELPIVPDEVLRRYRQSLGWYAGRWGHGAVPHDLDGLAGDWDAQVDLTAIVGLLLRGWRKGRDAEAGLTLPSGLTAAEDLAWWCDRAVEAAARRL